MPMLTETQGVSHHSSGAGGSAELIFEEQLIACSCRSGGDDLQIILQGVSRHFTLREWAKGPAQLCRSSYKMHLQSVVLDLDVRYPPLTHYLVAG